MPGILDNRRWDVLTADAGTERTLSEALGIAPLVARVLAARGITSVEEARAFLEPSLERDWADPLDIPGMAEAADRVERAITEGQRIAVFGDFDVDGMTSTCLLTQALRSLGAHCDPYIPHRFGEGYGLSREALARVIEGTHPDLIITVDNGIAACDEVAWLTEQGIDVVVTDHHEPGDLVPRGVPVTDPKLEESCYSRELAGAGVALKLVCELGRRLGQPDLWWDHVDLAALGTVSDMMQLLGENRSLVSYGLERMRHSSRPGILALAATADIDLTEVTADNLPFSLIPRLNAAGRMGTTEVAFDLLISEDMAEATTLAGMLERTNVERRDTEGRLSKEALARIEESYAGEQVIVVSGEGWHEGVKGIVASRITSRYHVPAIVFTITDGIARGSGRSVGSVDLFHAVEMCQDHLVRFGGHAGAVGVTCEAKQLPAFTARLAEVMGELPPEQFEDRGEVAALATLSELTQETIGALDVLQPFGQGNKRPLLGVRSVFMRNRARVGYEGNHLRFLATDGVASCAAIMFRTPQMARAYATDEAVDLVVDAVNETWQGRTSPKLMVRDICYRAGEAPSAAPQLARPVAAEPDEAAREVLQELDAAEVASTLVTLLLPDGEVSEAEQQLLARLEAGEDVTCTAECGMSVLALESCRRALTCGEASVVVCPISSLARSFAAGLAQDLSPCGMRVATLIAAEGTDVWKSVCERLARGELDVVVCTEACFAHVAPSLKQSQRVGLVCYLEQSSAGARELGCATLTIAGDADAGAGQEDSRAALRVIDARDARDRDMRLSSLVGTLESCVVYVDGQVEAERVCERIRRDVGDAAGRIATYVAGMDLVAQRAVERDLAEGSLSCVVCAGPLPALCGLPSPANLVLYSLPRTAFALAHLVGALRGQSELALHLLFAARETSELERRVRELAPGRDELVALYRTLMGEARRARGPFALDAEATAGRLAVASTAASVTVTTVQSGVAIFEELGFLRLSRSETSATIEMVERPGHVELTGSVRYVEAHGALGEIERVGSWALSARANDIAEALDRGYLRLGP